MQFVLLVILLLFLVGMFFAWKVLLYVLFAAALFFVVEVNTVKTFRRMHLYAYALAMLVAGTIAFFHDVMGYAALSVIALTLLSLLAFDRLSKYKTVKKRKKVRQPIRSTIS